MKECERKFLLTYLPDYFYCEDIQQGYLMIKQNKHLRVRIIDNKKGFLCFKTIISDTEKDEFEYEIPIRDAKILLSSTKIKLHKIRYKTVFDENTVDIDCYDNGLQVCEIEYKTELTELPDYCGKEVTGMKEYSNISISINNDK